MELRDLFEGGIEITQVTQLVDRAVRNAIRRYVDDLWLYYLPHDTPNRDDGETRSEAYQVFSNEISDDIVIGLRHILGDELTQMLNQFTKSKIPPRMRANFRDVVVQFHDSAGSRNEGSYNDIDNRLIIYVSNPDAIEVIQDEIQERAFGDANSITPFVNRIVSIFGHEYVHYEQWRRGLGGRVTRGYISKGGDKRGAMFGGHFNPSGGEVSNMRYTGAAHEIEAFATSAALELSRSDYDHRGASEIPSRGRIDDIIEDLKFAYADSSSLKRYQWLRQYRDEYISKGFQGHELERVFRRFMRLLYRKLIQLRDANGTPDEKRWETMSRTGIRNAITDIALDIPDQYSDKLYKAADFINRRFYNDEYDYHKIDQIENVLKKLIIARNANETQ